MSPTDHPHRAAWSGISTPDAPRARRFYQDLLGWPINVLDETYALAGDDGGQPTGGIGQAGPDSPYAGFVAYFPVDDVDSTLTRAEQLRGHPCPGPCRHTCQPHRRVHRPRRQPRRTGQPLTGPPDHHTGASLE
jgi:predicted enzyme related to lactoylglutathione lyase